MTAAVLAFALAPSLRVGGFLLLDRFFGHHRDPTGDRVLLVAVAVAIPAGYAFLARPFARWSDLEASSRKLCIVLSAIYWAIYTPLLLLWLLVILIGWNGPLDSRLRLEPFVSWRRSSHLFFVSASCLRAFVVPVAPAVPPRTETCQSGRHMKTARVALIVLVLLTARASADVRIVETTVVKAGDRVARGTRSTFIKGVRMRIEAVQADQSATTLYDLPAGVTLALDAQRQRAESRAIETRAAELEKQYPRARTEAKLTPTGATKELAGASCAEHAVSIRVPLTRDGDIALVMTGSTWIAAGAPGVADYEAFARAAIERQVVLGPASNNKILLAVARAQTELYRAISEVHGIPYSIDTATTVDGHGVLAGMISKVVSGTQTTTVTSITDAPIADSLFAVPDGWKRRRD